MTFEKYATGILYRLSPDEQLDQDAYGMLRNNAVEHIMGVNYNQLDDRRELRFSTEGLVSARDYFAQHVFNRQQFVDLLMGVADAFVDAEEYMLSTESFSNSLDTTFIDDRLNIMLTYVPIIGFPGCSGARVFIRDVRRCLKLDERSSDLSYLQVVDNALNQPDDFSVVEFKKLLASLTLRPKQSNLSSTGTGQGFAPVEESFAAPNLELSAGMVPAGQQPDGRVFSGQLPGGGGFNGPSNSSQGVALQGASGQLPISSAGGGVGDISIPLAGGAPSMFGDMAIPGMEGKQAPSDGSSEKKGLFGKGKKKKQPPAGKMSRAEKKAAKKAEKAAKKAAKDAAKASKKRKKGKSTDGGKSGGLFSRNKANGAEASASLPQGGMNAATFAIPGGNSGGAPGNSMPAGGMAVPTPPASQPQDGGVLGQGQGAMRFDSANQPPFGQQSPYSGSMGEQYSDNDFGITEVYGVIPDEAAQSSGVVSHSVELQSEHQGLPIVAYLYRESTGEKRMIDKTPFRVGRRRSEVDFHIAERPKVSRVHAVITFDGSRFIIRDNKSVNFTRINGSQIDPSESIALVNGDFIEMGDERFRFTIESS